ncbi:hypothetical protein OS493_017566 [Desmophyllum pertusum]|uniref:Uncharacterized protein n=1 Tax=Desmophyllum pertusum TaxID=174260 RepID=A0A9W9ZQ89_9CNID|nr:hypothetical protein OS493_017566 [Desmophyllum pertusum]
MKSLIVLGILCFLCLDIGQVEGNLVKKCPKCKDPAQCFADPCHQALGVVCPENTVCKSCYCHRPRGCDHTCDKIPQKG